MIRFFLSALFFIIIGSFSFPSTSFAWCIGGRGNTCPKGGAVGKKKTTKKKVKAAEPDVNPIARFLKQKKKKEREAAIEDAYQRARQKQKDAYDALRKKRIEITKNFQLGISFPTYSYPNHPGERKVLVTEDQFVFAEYVFTPSFSTRLEYVSQKFGGFGIVSSYKHTHYVTLFNYRIDFDKFIAKMGMGFGYSSVTESSTTKKKSVTEEGIVEKTTTTEKTYSGFTLAYHISVLKKFILFDQNIVFGPFTSTLDGKVNDFNLGSTNFGLQLGLFF